MKKCKGCGIELQFIDQDKEGYAPNESFDYCQRCFRLTHYGDTKKVVHDLNDNIKIFEGYKDIKDALYVLIVDCFDSLFINDDKLIEFFLDRDILLVINKIDLLPRNITDNKIEKLYIKQLNKYKNFSNLTCVLTYKNDNTFNDLFFSIMNEKGYKKAVFVGRVNAGKSSIINKLTKDYSLTTSIYPGTTVAFNKIKLNDYYFIDTPGLLDDESFITYLDNEKVKKILPLKTLKAQNFQVYDKQAYFVEGLIEVIVEPIERCSLTFFINNNLEVHRTKKENADKYFSNNKKDFELIFEPFNDHKYRVEKYNTFYLKGLGCFKIKGKCNINIRSNDKIKIYKNEVNI